ncbi:MAG: HD domain-containing protein [Oscillospiraceae bacterium]|nr:HD domain-containing protein [Oscillospiraceae bacterium]
MKIAMDKLCMVFSRAFDIIEKEQLGASENHSLRVAVMCVAMGKRLGYGDETISAIAICGMFHDSALTEYHLSQQAGELQEQNMFLHCKKGQENVSWLPFDADIEKLVLYHHERGDGQGPLHRKENEIPLEAAIIAAADAIDATYHLQRILPGGLPALREKIAFGADIYSTRAAVDVLLDVLNGELLEKMRDENVRQTLECELPSWKVDVEDPKIIRVGEFISRVIDYKSEFTHTHTSQIANRAWIMADHYGYGTTERNALFLAASLHDIGKIGVPTEILEKPGKLDDDEFATIKKHVKNTLDWLGEIPDFDQIRYWAANHHEKLGGFGYSRGITKNELDFNSRLMACIDIYQAVCEPRPYHSARSHGETMQILRDMASKGFIEEKIVEDIDGVMEKYSLCPVPSPFDGGETKASGETDDRMDFGKKILSDGYRCDVCGYFYAGDHLPKDFVCPVCKRDAGHFIKISAKGNS